MEKILIFQDLFIKKNKKKILIFQHNYECRWK